MISKIIGNNTIAMSRVGCGNGKLNWGKVKPKIEKILDDRFVVYQV